MDDKAGDEIEIVEKKAVVVKKTLYHCLWHSDKEISDKVLTEQAIHLLGKSIWQNVLFD